jgi:hypothetical protein
VKSQVSESQAQVAYGVIAAVVGLIAAVMGASWLFTSDDGPGPVLIIGLVVVVCAVAAYRHLRSARDIAHRRDRRWPRWLREKRGDDWSRGILQRRLELLPWGVALGFTWFFVTCAFLFPHTLWLAAIGAATIGCYVRPLRQLIVWLRSGTAMLVATRLPAVLGSAFAGRVETSLKTAPADGFYVRLVCTEFWQDEGIQERIVWEHSIIASPQWDRLKGTIAIPFSFVASKTLPPTNRENPGRWIVWTLEVSASLPGINFGTRFEVPVVAEA